MERVGDPLWNSLNTADQQRGERDTQNDKRERERCRRDDLNSDERSDRQSDRVPFTCYYREQ